MAGGFFGWLSKKDDLDYEKLLADIDEKIRRSELNMSEFSLRERRLLHALVLYAVPTYVVVLVVYVIYVRNAAGEPWDLFLLKSLPIGIFPLVAYILRVLVITWYTRCRTFEEEHLETLRKKQSEKIEELKKRTAFYKTKGLIERYDPAAKKSQKQGTPGPRTPGQPGQPGQPQQQPGHPQPPPGQPQQQPGQPGQQPQQHRPPNAPSPHAPHQALPRQAHPQQPQHMMQQGPQSQHPLVHPGSQIQHPRGWFDKLLDVMVGESDGPQHKYALICETCFTHNGLVLPEEYLTAKFKCMQCGHLNTKKPVAQTLDFDIRRAPSASGFNTPSPPGSPSMGYRHQRRDSTQSNASNLSQAGHPGHDTFSLPATPPADVHDSPAAQGGRAAPQSVPEPDAAEGLVRRKPRRLPQSDDEQSGLDEQSG
ncbi:hypothetical protein HK105_200725 [Polyrhizophydium stewartii]|uniref:Endoplasmic reticulum junction formation protein lunapark n=1 Tax=Polyrhizophydium stewartii TaxID=2732419 RepID=A0ABR4NJT6_9FUNG